MTRSLRAVLTLFAALGLAGSASSARADCPPNTGVCAELSVGGAAMVETSRGAQVVITVGPVRPPQIVVVRPPPPPVVVVRPPPPPQIVYVRPPPPPQVVYVRPPPPQVVYQQPQVVYQQQPQVVYQQQPQVVYQQQQSYRYQQPSAPRDVTGTTGLRFFLAGASGGNARLGGMGVAFRMRPSEHFAVDLGVGVYGGQDHYKNSRVELPVTADFLAFVNPQSRAQFYGVAGLGASFAFTDRSGKGVLDRSYTYVGGSLGAGIEFRLTRGFALNIDGRAVLRTQTRGPAEFTRIVGTTEQTTRTSAGFVGQFGATLYF